MVRAIIGQMDKATLDRVHFKAFGSSSLDFEAVYFIESPGYNQYMDRQQQVNLALFERVPEGGHRVRLSYPDAVRRKAPRPSPG
ncbi:MAG: hypothetical protein HY554_04745 [Elusimicrobia bacterium]|nr:hypothetical protein [Elusimicrobiota bacterium]